MDLKFCLSFLMLVLFSRETMCEFIGDNFRNNYVINVQKKGFQPFRRFTICFGDRCLNELEFRKMVNHQRELQNRKGDLEKNTKKKPDNGNNYSILREFNGFRSF